MLVVNDIRENIQKAVLGLEKRNLQGVQNSLEHIIELDDNRKNTQSQLDNLLAESNAISKSIGAFMREGKTEEAEKAKSQTAELKQKSKSLGEQLHQLEADLRQQLLEIPNVPNEKVPAGKGENDNEIITTEGDPVSLYEGATEHWELIKQYDIIDFELGSKISGAGFPVYKGKGARLQRGLVNFFLDEATKEGYHEIQPPIVINEESGYGTGQLPDKEGQMYHVQAEDLYLIPTAEVPITNMFRDVIVSEEELPLKKVGYTPCFRREAGSWGAHVRGLNRLHQFDKVEIVQIQHPEKSYQALDEMCKYVTGLLSKLGLHYRILNLCGGDLGFTSAQTFDMEVFSAAQGKWLEVSSVSNFETYQSNRLKLRYRDSDRKTHLTHTLNGSALALPRIVAALLENNQTKDGIVMPEILQPYLGFDIIS